MMIITTIMGEISLLILIGFFFFFSLYSFIEKEKRSFLRSFIIIIFFCILNIFLLFTPQQLKIWIFGSIFILLTSVIVFLIFPPLKRKETEIQGIQIKIDERDVIFSRFDYQEGTKIYEDYYTQRPEYKKRDEEIRKIPDILSPYHIHKNPLLFSLADEEFHFLESQLDIVSGKVKQEKVELSPRKNTQIIKEAIKFLGSDLCGISLLNQAYIYSNVGRGPEPYGKNIELNHKYAITFAVEMDLEIIACAPQPPVIVETAKKYVEVAKISIITANFIRSLGYPARAHIAGSNYQAVLPPIAAEAGLGELGRLGILITYKYGPRVRLGLVTTDLPLIPDEPKVLGIQNFCEKCQKCARNCPSQAIPYGEKIEENGVLKWVLEREECYRFWRKSGTDCSVCVYVCPYSKASNAFHKFIRKMAEKSFLAQTMLVLGDDFFYGRTPKRRKTSLFNI